MRKTKSNPNSNLFLAAIGIIMVAIAVFLGLKLLNPGEMGGVDEQIPGETTEATEQEKEEQPEIEKPKEYVYVVFIGQNEAKEEVYKVVRREYSEDVDGSKMTYAINTLIMGPKGSEKSQGVYSEIPTSTRLIGVQETTNKVIINLSENFAFGGGTDSVYKRLYQLIKTVKKNTDKPVYLHINGKQADVIGGDGIMITQPLSENSISE